MLQLVVKWRSFKKPCSRATKRKLRHRHLHDTRPRRASSLARFSVARDPKVIIFWLKENEPIGTLVTWLKKRDPSKNILFFLCLVGGRQRGPQKSKKGKRGANSGKGKWKDEHLRNPSSMLSTHVLGWLKMETKSGKPKVRPIRPLQIKVKYPPE